MDLFVVPAIGFKRLYGFVVVRIDRRDLVSITVTANPTAEWIARQKAFLWDGAPGYMVRDRDRIHGAVVTRRLRAMAACGRKAAIKHRPIGARTPRGTQINAARTRQNEPRAKHKFRAQSGHWLKQRCSKSAKLIRQRAHVLSCAG
jgi:hypothetical protein